MASLSQLVDVYLQLHENSRIKEPKPVHLTLSFRTRFQWQLEVLKSAVAEGKGVEVIEDFHHTDALVSGGVFKDDAELGFDNPHHNSGQASFEEAAQPMEPTNEPFQRPQTPRSNDVGNDDLDLDFDTPIKSQRTAAVQSADLEIAVDDGPHANEIADDLDFDNPVHIQKSSDVRTAYSETATGDEPHANKNHHETRPDRPKVEDISTQLDQHVNPVELTDEDEQHFDIDSYQLLDESKKPSTDDVLEGLDTQATQFDDSFEETGDNGEFFEGPTEAATQDFTRNSLPTDFLDNLAGTYCPLLCVVSPLTFL